MMKRLSLILMLLSLVVVQHIHAQYYSVNYDARTVAAMATASVRKPWRKAITGSRSMDILKHYNAAEVATAGILPPRFLGA